MTRDVEEQFVAAGAIWTRYFVAGDGPPLVMLHGSSLAIDARATWFRTMPALSSRFRVFAPDLVGFGMTDVAADGAHVPRLERRKHARAFLAALGIDRCALVGHSEGGFIAAMLALEEPGLVSDLVIVASGATAPVLGGDLDRDWSAAASAAYDVTGGCETIEDFLTTNSRLSKTNPADLTAILRENYVLARDRGQLERLKAASVQGDYRRYNQIQEDVLLPNLHRLDARVLLIWPAADETVPVTRGVKLLERVPQADMHILGGAAHMVMIDRDKAFNDLLLAWLAREDDGLPRC